MVTKSLRMLIVEPCFVQSLIIEKMLNRLGYFGIATARCVDEAWTLNLYGLRTFDVVAINVCLLSHPRALALLGDGALAIPHRLVYGLASQPVMRVIGVSSPSVIELVPGVPEYQRISEFMARVDGQHSIFEDVSAA